MKSLKFSSDQVNPIKNGEIYKTWRLYDDKELNVGDNVVFIDSGNNQAFGSGRINKITIKRLCDLDDNDREGHKQYNSEQEMLSEFHKYYRQQVNLDTIVKVIEYDFAQETSKNNDENITMKHEEIKIFTDGGSRGNPGPSACAYVITDMNDNVVKISGQYLGITTNNQAEYQAVKLALIEAKKYSAQKLYLYLDSLLVVNQMNGIFKIKNRDLWPINQDIRLLTQAFTKVIFTHIPREMNKLADQEVNEILDNANKKGLSSDLL